MKRPIALYGDPDDYSGQPIDVVVGGQYGSEGKGAVAAALCSLYANTGRSPISIRVGGPNAGHTAVDPAGRAWALRSIPVGAVTADHGTLLISAGSEIDLDVLHSEVTALDAAGFNVRRRLIIDSQATIITEADKQAEVDLTAEIGSTGKGIGAARAARLMRKATIAADLRASDLAGFYVVDSTGEEILAQSADEDEPIVIEGTQGYALGLHAGRYPYCTSGDVRAIDALAQVGISPWHPSVGPISPWVVLRANPIRVAGNSGPMLGETTWEELGLPEERTTVTKKVRRVGAWDAELASEAIVANGWNVHVALTMVDHVDPEIAGKSNFKYEDGKAVFTLGRGELPAGTLDWLDKVESHLPFDARVGMIGTGPASHMWI